MRPKRRALASALGWAILLSFCLDSPIVFGRLFRAQFAEVPYGEKQKKLVSFAIDRVAVEIAREYITSKGMGFPKAINSLPALEEFLKKTYPEEKHELRLAVSNLRVYRDQFVASRDGAVGHYVRRGIAEYAIDLHGNALKYNREKIEDLIREVVDEDDQLQVPLTDIRRNESPVPTSRSKGVSVLPDIIRSHSLALLSILLLTNLVLLCVVIWMWTQLRRRPIASEAEVIRSDDGRAIIATSHDQVIADQTPRASAPRKEGPPASTVMTDSVSVLPATGIAHNGDWLVVRTSVAGKLHIDSDPPIPCQDSNTYRDMGKGWGIAVVCDGAGSKKFSHHGSAFVADKTVSRFAEIVETNGWKDNGQLPLEDQWGDITKRVFNQVKIDLEQFSREQHSIDSSLLSCTVIIMIHSPIGILAAHVGDGRAAFCNLNNEWKAVMKPRKGEEANQTVFITSIDGTQPDDYIESRVFAEKPCAFTLMSDGCEAHSFEVNIFDEEKHKYTDPNRPYEKFFHPLMVTLKRLHEDATPDEEIARKWEQFIKQGNEKLKNEPDDKSMILGVLVS